VIAAVDVTIAVERSEAWRHDADYRGGNALNGEDSAQYVRVAVEAALPVGIADDDGLVFVVKIALDEDAAEDGVDAKHIEEGWRDVLEADGFGHADAGEVGCAGGAGHGDVVEGVALLLPVVQLGDGRVDASVRASWNGLPDCDEARRVFVRQGTVEEGVKDAEDGAGGADSERERENDHGNEAWILEKASDSIAQILQ
jgi:hypothetical protein